MVQTNMFRLTYAYTEHRSRVSGPQGCSKDEPPSPEVDKSVSYFEASLEVLRISVVTALVDMLELNLSQAVAVRCRSTYFQTPSAM